MKDMKRILAIILASASLAAAWAQDASSNTGVRRRDPAAQQQQQSAPQVSDRMRASYGSRNESLSEGDVQWMRVVYREIDLNKDKNAPLYFPEDLIDGQENLFRIILRLAANGDIKAYEYLDGREVFTDQTRIKMDEMLNQFYIPYEMAKGSTEKNPKYAINEFDVPTREVLAYYIIERWEFDNRNNRMRTYVDAICPVLVRAGDFGDDMLRYPMFWVKYDDLRPYLLGQEIFLTDDNNLPTCTYDDYFTLNLYEGDIYKTRNLRNRSLKQMYPDPDEMALAQDSIQRRLETFEDRLWVPDREEIIAQRKSKEKEQASADEPAAVDNDADKSDKAARTTRSGSKRTSTKKDKAKKPKVDKPKSNNSGNSNSARSVRRRR